MLYIGIDPSLSSTVVCLEEDGKTRYFNYTTHKSTGKWFKALSGEVNFIGTSYSFSDEYSLAEKQKISTYDKLTDDIVDDLYDITGDEECTINIEGYSYASDVGPLIDLVTFSTLLRIKLLGRYGVSSVNVVPPTALKRFACMCAYVHLMDEKALKKKKVVYRSDEGIAGGSFKKREMLKAAFDYEKNCTVLDGIRDQYDYMLEMKSVPKPVDDIIDAFWLKEKSKRGE